MQVDKPQKMIDDEEEIEIQNNGSYLDEDPLKIDIPLAKKTKPITRVTAYSLFTKSVRAALLKEKPNLSFGELNTRFANMWNNLTNLERYNWKRRAKRFKEKQIIAKREEGSKLPESLTPKISPAIETEENRISSKGRKIVTSKKFEDFGEIGQRKTYRKKSKV